MTREEFEELLNSWVFQQKGPINHYKKHHQGTQPIRVVHHMLVYMFAHSHPDFIAELQKLVEVGKLNPVLDLVYAEESIKSEKGYHTPRVRLDTRQIMLHETFLSYLWCVTYAIYILYIEKVDYPAMNKIAGREKYPVSDAEIDRARELFAYAKSLIAYYSPWDKDGLPNPETYLAERRNYIEQTNLCYTEAVKFILAHELTHLKHHIDKINNDTPESYYLDFEAEADQEAILNSIKGRNGINEIAINCGIVIGLLSMLFFSADTTGKRHPATEDRITAALELLESRGTDYAWGMACIGLELWEEQFDLHFDWLAEPVSPKTQYYHLIEQIKQR